MNRRTDGDHNDRIEELRLEVQERASKPSLRDRLRKVSTRNIVFWALYAAAVLSGAVWVVYKVMAGSQQ